MNNFDGSKSGNVWLRKHGHCPVSGSSPTYITWVAMRYRCRTPGNRYHDLGIRVCKKWNESFEGFLEDMGVRPESCTIDRIDPYKGYYLENCRWASSKLQAENRVTTKPVMFFGVPMLLTDIAKQFGVPQTTIYRRNKQGYVDQDLIDRPNKNRLRVGEKCPSSKLKSGDIIKIREMYSSGIEQMDISLMFNISQSHISNIVNRKVWRHV